MNHLVSYADTDAAGVLHHARYIELAERGYLEWMKRRNLSFRKLNLDHNVTLVVCDITARYRAAVLLEEEVQIVTKLQAIDRTGLHWKTVIMKDGQVSFSMLTKMACVDNVTKTIISVPDLFVARLVSEVEPVKMTKRRSSSTRLVTGSSCADVLR